MRGREKKQTSTAIKVALIFYVFSFLWFLFFHGYDSILNDSGKGGQQFPDLNFLFFIVLSGVLLYFVVIYFSAMQRKTREKLEKQLAYYEKVFENYPLPVWICEKETGKILRANISARELNGSLSQKLQDLNLQDFLTDEYKEEIVVSEIFAEGNHSKKPFKSKYGKKSGEFADVELNWRRFSDSEGKVFCIVTANDVTERNRAIDSLENSQKACLESERQLKTLMNNLPGMVYRSLLDPSWTMKFIGGSFLEVTGYSADDMIDNKKVSFGELIHADDRERVWEEVNEKLGKQEPWQVEYRIIDAEGETRQVWEQAEGVYDEKGQLLQIEGFILDVTRQRKNERAIKYYAGFLQNLINNIPFPLFYKDLQGRFKECNKSFCQYLNLEYDEIIGRTSMELFANASGFHDIGDKELKETGKQQKYETSIVFPDGSVRNAVFYKSLYHDPEGQPEGIIGIYVDISERVQAEEVIKKQIDELERINKELERFTYTVSHDLRSPLVTIKGFLGFLREDALAGDQEQIEDDIKRISGAADKMHNLLEDLLQLSRVGRIGNPFTRFSMNEAVEEVLEYLDGIISRENCLIRVQKEMPEVYGDRERIMEALQNLIENAIKFKNPDSRPEIEIGSFKEESEVVFYVKDNGQGIKKEYQRKIFDLFNKLDPLTSGTGIGLALVQRIIEFHGGRIWVESEGEEKGTTFLFTLGND